MEAIEERYNAKEMDEFLNLIIVNGNKGRIKGVWFRPQLILS